MANFIRRYDRCELNSLFNRQSKLGCIGSVCLYLHTKAITIFSIVAQREIRFSPFVVPFRFTILFLRLFLYVSRIHLRFVLMSSGSFRFDFVCLSSLLFLVVFVDFTVLSSVSFGLEISRTIQRSYS